VKTVEEIGKYHLTDWNNIMAGENRLKRITWLIGGAKQNESMLVTHINKLYKDVCKLDSSIEHSMYTNCLDVDNWKESYIVNMKGKQYSRLFQKNIEIAVQMYWEEKLKSDIYMCNDFSMSFAVYGLGLGMYDYPHIPVVSILGKVPENGVSSHLSPETSKWLLNYLINDETHWILIFDNQEEENILRKLISNSKGGEKFDRIRRFGTYVYRPENWVEKEYKKDVVVWSGRANVTKNPKLGAEVFALLPSTLRKEVFHPTSSGKDDSGFHASENVRIYTNEPPDIYRELTKQAKVIVITSMDEAYAIGYLELFGQGVIPVVWDRKWAKDLLPEGYELYFRTAGEGAEKVLEAIKNYDRYASQIKEWMSKRFVEKDFGDVLKEIWLDYTDKVGNRIRLVTDRGTRRRM